MWILTAYSFHAFLVWVAMTSVARINTLASFTAVVVDDSTERTFLETLRYRAYKLWKNK